MRKRGELHFCTTHSHRRVGSCSNITVFVSLYYKRPCKRQKNPLSPVVDPVLAGYGGGRVDEASGWGEGDRTF